MAYFKGKSVMQIGVYRTDHASAAEAAGGGMHGNISAVGYTASAIRDWIDMGDAVRSAWGASDECAYAVMTDDNQWHTLEDGNDLMDEPRMAFRVCYETTREMVLRVFASSHEEARDIVNAGFASGNMSSIVVVRAENVSRITWCDIE